MMAMVAMQLDDVKPAEIEPASGEDDFPELTTYLEQSEEDNSRDEFGITAHMYFVMMWI